MKKIFKQLKEIKMAREEKDSLKTFLLNYIKTNPVSVRKEPLPRLQLEKGNKEIVATFANFKFLPALTALILIIFIGTGISIAAEKSLPGDIFYPVKIKVIENVKSAITFSKKNKAEFEIEKTDRRLKEIEALLNKGKLSVDIIDKTEKDLIKHINKTVEISSELKNQNKKEEAINLDSALEKTLLTHNKEAINNENETDNADSEKKNIKIKMENFHNKIEVKAGEIREERMKIENEIKDEIESDTDLNKQGKKGRGDKNDKINEKDENKKGNKSEDKKEQGNRDEGKNEGKSKNKNN